MSTPRGSANTASPDTPRATAFRHWPDEEHLEADDLNFKPLSAEEAQRWRQAHGAVSPWRVVAVQALVGVAVAVAAGALTLQAAAAVSALYGALAVVLPAGLMARGLGRVKGGMNAGAYAVSFMSWELVKMAGSVALLVLAPRILVQVHWLALVAGVVACVKVYWVALWWRGRGA